MGKLKPEALKFLKMIESEMEEGSYSQRFKDLIEGASPEDIQEFKDFFKGALDSVVIATPDPKGGFYLINSDILTLCSITQEDASEEQIKRGEALGISGVRCAGSIKVKWLDLFAVGHVEEAHESWQKTNG